MFSGECGQTDKMAASVTKPKNVTISNIVSIGNVGKKNVNRQFYHLIRVHTNNKHRVMPCPK